MERSVTLEQRVRDPGYTPGASDIERVVDLLADEALASHAERALGRAGPGALKTLRRRFEHAAAPLRGRVLRAIARFVQDEAARALLVSALEDADPKTRRNAAIALGHAGTSAVEDALLAAWDTDPRHEMRRSIAASLGKVGTVKSLAVLRAACRSSDEALSRISERAALMVERTASRAHRGRLEVGGIPPRPVAVLALARRGLEELLAEELASAQDVTGVRVVAPGQVRAMLAGPLSRLFAARTMLSFCLPLPAQSVETGSLDEAVARAAASPEAALVFTTWTVGAPRYRIRWTAGGHKRALAWAVARAVARSAPALVNDPTASLWEMIVGVTDGTVQSVQVALAPRALDDPRTTWRKRDVPAASHPTIAAALVHVAGVREDDVVWDPFVGSAAELIERALAGPFARLEGSDTSRSALAAARENLAAAGIQARLEQADALVHAPPGVTLILTNPPMGRRSERVAGLGEMLAGFVEHAASVLMPGGRLVWLAPRPASARSAAARAGLALEWARLVDMGGFDAELQHWRKR